MITRTKPIPKKRKTPRRGRVLNPAFLLFVRQFRCLACWRMLIMGEEDIFIPDMIQDTHTEAAHVGSRGLGQKCNDDETLPLCAWHHRTGQQSAHVLGRKFWNHHMLDRDKLIAEMQKRFMRETNQAL